MWLKLLRQVSPTLSWSVQSWRHKYIICQSLNGADKQTRYPDAPEYNGKPLFQWDCPFPKCFSHLNAPDPLPIPDKHQHHTQNSNSTAKHLQYHPSVQNKFICNSPGLLGDLSYMGREQSSVRDLTGATVITSAILLSMLWIFLF